MSESLPAPIPFSTCALYTPGHRVHFIQAKLSWESDREMLRRGRLVTVDDDGWITVDVGGDEVRVWNHEAARAHACIEAAHGHVMLKGYGVLAAPSERGRPYFCIGDVATPCAPPDPEPDNSPEGIVAQVLSRGGVMIPGVEAIRALNRGGGTEPHRSR
jgi:hypothetical protein